MAAENTQNSPSSNSLVMKLFLTFGRGLAYAICIWGVYLVFHSMASRNSGNTSSYEQQRAEQVSAYQEQVTKWKEQASESENQQKRAEVLLSKQEKFEKRASDLLSKQEEQARRFDLVISAWEKQNEAKK